MSRVDPDENPEYPDSPRYDEYGEVESSIGENEYVGPNQNVNVDELKMETRLDMAVDIVRSLIENYDLKKGIQLDNRNSVLRMKGYYHLLFALMRLEHEMDPDFAWYEKRISFENGYGASIICKPVSYGGDAKMFEIAVLKFGEICYDTPVSYDVEGYLDFKDVIEVLHEIRELPPAEKDDVEEDDVEYKYVHPRWDQFHLRYEEDKKNGREDRRDERVENYAREIAKKNADKGGQDRQGPEQEEANPYEVPTGPTSGVMTSGIVARVGPQLPSFRFDVNDLVWYIGDDNEWPGSKCAIPERVPLQIMQRTRLSAANGEFVENAYWIRAKRGRGGYFVSPNANTSGAQFENWQVFPNVPERLLSDTYLPPLTLDSE